MEDALAHYSAKMRKEKETAKVRVGWDERAVWPRKLGLRDFLKQISELI